MNATLTLVGTVHRDRCGEEKLLRLLEALRPDELTLEMSPAALDYRNGYARTHLLRLERILDRLAEELGRDRRGLRAHPAVDDIWTLLAPPFEYRAAAAYAGEAGVPLSLIDLSSVSTVKLRRVESDLITYRNLKVLVGLPEKAAREGDEGYEVARAMVREGAGEAVRHAFLRGRRGEEGIGPRDLHMAGEIRRRLAARPERHLVHIGGWVHLVEDDEGETLYSRLRDLEPRRLLLE